MTNCIRKILKMTLRGSPLLLGLLIIACTKPIQSTIGPNGSMDILGPVSSSITSPILDGWITTPPPSLGQFSVVQLKGITALKVVSGTKGVITVKKSQASLLATPYLSWAWNMEAQDNGEHPVRLFVGFQNTAKQTRPWLQSLIGLGETLPYHDRMLSLTWGDSALQRGTIKTNSTSDPKILAQFTVRGGQENSGTWWFEQIDLYDIYRQAWPIDRIERTQITFIGVGIAPANTRATGFISGLRLSR